MRLFPCSHELSSGGDLSTAILLISRLYPLPLTVHVDADMDAAVDADVDGWMSTTGRHARCTLHSAR